MSDEFEVIKDPAEAVRIKLSPRYVKPAAERFVQAVDLMNAGEVLFIPGAEVNKVSQYRLYMTRRHHRKLMTRTAERDGVQGLYMWAGQDR